MERVRFGVVGTGGIFYGWGGGSGYLPSYPKVREAKVVALCDIDENRLRMAEKKLKSVLEEEAKLAEEKADDERKRELLEDVNELKTYTKFSQMIRSESLDVVHILTPPKSHASLAIQALHSGFHVMCEKPMARNWLECLPILEAVKETGRFYQHSEQLIFESPWYDTKKFVDAGVIGEPLLMFFPHTIGEAKPVRWNAALSGGGSLTDMGAHGIVTSWFIFGFHRNPTRVKAVEPYGIGIKMRNRLIRGLLLEPEVEDDAHIVVDFEDGRTGSRVTVHIEASFSYRDSEETKIIGTNGVLVPGDPTRIFDVFGNKREVKLWGVRDEVTEAYSPYYTGFIGQLRNMCRSVLEKKKPICNERIGAEAMAVINAAYLSEVRGRRAVSIDEFKEYALKIKEREGDRASDVMMTKFMEKIRR